MSVLAPSYLLDIFNEPGDKTLVNKGNDALSSNHVMSFDYYPEDKILMGTIQASMKNKAYKVRIALGEEVVINRYCECLNGRNKCHHMATLLLHGMRNLSSTSVPMSWLAAPKTALKLLVDFKPVETYSTLKTSPHLCALEWTGPADTQMMLNPYTYGFDDFLSRLKRSSPASGVVFINLPEPPPVVTPWDYLKIKEVMERDDFTAARRTDPEGAKEEFYKIIRFDTRQNLQLSSETEGQFTNRLYCNLKQYRLTASNFKGPLHVKIGNEESLAKRIVKSNEDVLPYKALQYGIYHEEDARISLQVLLRKNIKKVGLFLHGSGVIGASPDGMLEDCSAIVEIKCPYKFKDMSPDKYVKSYVECVERATPDLFTNRSKVITDMSYLKIIKGEIKMNPGHDYYHQVQGQMAITGIDVCYFYLWSNFPPCFCLRVAKDPAWLVNLEKLVDFHKTFIYPLFAV